MKNFLLKFIFLWILINKLIFNAFCSNLDSIEYIVISRVGANYSLPSIVLSTYPIKKIEYDTFSFEENVKYRVYENFILSRDLFNCLFNYLNLYKTEKSRQKGFLGKYQLLIDFRVKNKDFELVSTNSLSLSLFVLKFLYCRFKQENVPKHLMERIADLYICFIRTYKAEEGYRNIIECDCDQN